MSTRRGQAAIEFLMTYGWAFIVILVAIGALAYFGVLDGNAFIPEKCLMSQGFSCVDFQADRSGANMNVSFFLRNGLGSSVTISPGAILVEARDYSLDSGTSCPSSTVTIGVEELAEISCAVGLSVAYPPVGDKAKFDVFGTYVEIGGRYNHSFDGQIVASVR